MINVIKEPTTEIAFDATTQDADLARGVFLEKLQINIAGTVSIAGGTTNGTVVSDGFARLIRRFRIMRDREAIVDINGRDLLLQTRAGAKVNLTGTELSSAAAGTYPFSLTLHHYFARPWLVNPFETVLPPMRITSQFKALFDWARDVNAGAGSGAGSGVLVSGGDRAVTFSVAPTINVVQHGTLRGKLPWYLPYMTSIDTEQFAAANPRLRFPIPTGREARRFDSFFISPRQGTLENEADLLNTLLIGQQGASYYNRVRNTDLRAELQEQFPAFAGELDYFIRMADGGWLGNVVEPGSMTAPLLEFDVDAPSGTGIVHLLFNELVTHPEYTLVQDVSA